MNIFDNSQNIFRGNQNLNGSRDGLSNIRNLDSFGFNSPLQREGGFQSLPFQQFLLFNLFQQLVTLLQAFNQAQQPQTMQGSPFNDTLIGDRFFNNNDSIFGNAGNDLLLGLAGNDYLNGGAGNDRLLGGSGNDTLQDDAGSNIFNGGSGDDTLRLAGNLSDYSIKPLSNQGNGSAFIIQSLSTGERSIAQSIESFEFADQTLTNDQLQTLITPPQTIPVTGDQDSAIRQRFDIGNGSSYRALDKNGDQALSEGDQLEVTVGGDAISVIALTAEDIEAINAGPNPQELQLSQAQQEAVGARFNNRPQPFIADGITTVFTGVVVDSDGNGELSEGDVVKLRDTGGLLGLDRIRDHELTAEDLAFIQSDRSDPLLDISNGLSNEQNQRLFDVIYGNQFFTSAPSIQSVFDGNSDGKLSVGDTVIINQFNEATGATEVSFHELSQADIDQFLLGKNGEAQSALDASREKWEGSGLEQSGYSFRLERSAFTLPEFVRPTVNTVDSNGNVTDVFADDGQPVPDDYNQANATVNTLFDVIQNAIDSGADGVNVEYDPVSGFPISIAIDFDERIADEELFLRVSNLQAL